MSNKKLIVSEGRPRNNKERDALQKNKKKQTMLAFVNFPTGRKTKTTRKVELNNESPILKQATLSKSACKVSKTAPRAVYKKYNNLVYSVAMDVGMKSMFETGGNGNEALVAIQLVSSIIIPRSTLRSRYKIAKKELEAEMDDPHEDAKNEDLHIFDRAEENK